MLGIDRAEQGIRPIGYITSLGPSQSTTKPFPNGVPKRKKFAFSSDNKKYSRYHEKEAQDKQSRNDCIGIQPKKKKDKARSGSRGVSIASLQ